MVRMLLREYCYKQVIIELIKTDENVKGVKVYSVKWPEVFEGVQYLSDLRVVLYLNEFWNCHPIHSVGLRKLTKKHTQRFKTLLHSRGP